MKSLIIVAVLFITGCTTVDYRREYYKEALNEYVQCLKTAKQGVPKAETQEERIWVANYVKQQCEAEWRVVLRNK